MLGNFIDFLGSSCAASAILGNLRSLYKVMVIAEVFNKVLKIIAVAFVFSHGFTSMKKGDGCATECPKNEDGHKGALLNGSFAATAHPIDKIPSGETGKENHDEKHTRRHDCNCCGGEQGYHLALSFSSSISFTGTLRMREMSFQYFLQGAFFPFSQLETVAWSTLSLRPSSH